MKHIFIGNSLEGFPDDWKKMSDMEINVLQVALTHLIEELDDSEDLQEGRFSLQLNIAKKLYQGLGGKRFWELKMTEEDANKLSERLKEGEKK